LGLIGFAYARIQQNERAKEYYERALSLDNELGDVHFLMSCMYADDNFDPAKQAYHGERGFQAKNPAPLSLESCWNAAHGYLGLNDYEKGFNYYEARLGSSKLLKCSNQALVRNSKPLWRGQTHVERDGQMRPTIVRVHSEMGLGDAFIMARFLKLIQAMGVKVIFECFSNMLSLMQHNFPDIKCVPYEDLSDTEFDYHLPMMSLPVICKTTKESVPWDGPYILAEPEKIEEWTKRIFFSHDRLNVGVCWAAGKNSWNAGNHNTHFRKSIPFDKIESILKTPGMNFISLQTERDSVFPNPGIRDFSDTAAIISQLDMVISIDSAVANLTGAMGKELWLLDRFDHCWRWNDIQTPWYPNTKIFRQPTPRDWDSVVDNLKDALSKKCDKMAA